MAYVATLAIRLLAGAGHVDVDGLEPGLLGSRKARSLLWLLAVARGSPVSVDVIVQALWAQTPPAHPGDQVAVLVSRLRGVLGRERLTHGDAGYRLRYDWLDVDEIDALTGEVERRLATANHSGAAAAARVAVSLLRAQPSGPDVDSSWAAGRLDALGHLVARARHVAAGALLSSGAWLEAADVAASALSADGFDEQALRLLMRANVAGGRTGMALAAYAAARDVLAEELGTDPSAETEQLHAAILRGQLTDASSTRGRAVDASTTIVGRQVELARLDAAAGRAREGVVQIVVVEGEAGIGKTSLVRSWSASVDTGDLVLFGSCGELGRSAPLEPLLSVLAAHLRELPDQQAADILGAEAALLAPLLGFAAAGSIPPLLADGVVGPTLLFTAIASVLGRLASTGVTIVVLDDAHRCGSALLQWLEFVRTRPVPLLVLATVRSPHPGPASASEVVPLGPLDRAESEQLVGADRADSLFDRSGGHPLLLTELALAPDGAGLPVSLVQAVSTRCDALGRAGELLRTAAVVGDRVDPDLLAAVLNRPAIEILDDAEVAVAHHLLVDADGSFRFRHSLVREALQTTAGASRSAWLHRQVARVLDRRSSADPAEVADHARRGGDLPLAAASLRAAAARAAERFDHATAEALLDDALGLHPDPVGWLDRARIRTRRGDYAAAYRDVERARPVGASALEVGAWASYFDRRFEQAAAFAADGAAVAEDDAVRSRCLTVAGRTEHAAGDLAAAQDLLARGVAGSSGADRMIASAWLGVLRSHQSRTADALSLMRPATRPELRAEHTSATLHALLFTGHAHALAGRPAAALEHFRRYDAEVERRDVARFAGRGTNFAGWVLRSLGAAAEAADLHQQVFERAVGAGTAETRIASLEDLAEHRLLADDPDSAVRHLDQARALLHGDLVFGWRLRLRLALLDARTALALEQPEAAATLGEQLAAEAGTLGVPRYASVARLVTHRAHAAAGRSVDLEQVEADLAQVAAAVAVEAWWWTGESGAAHRVPAWVDRASRQVADLAANSAERRGALLAAAAARLDAWRTAAQR